MLRLWLARTYFIATTKLSGKEYTLFKSLIYLPEIDKKQESKTRAQKLDPKWIYLFMKRRTLVSFLFLEHLGYSL